MARRDWDPDRPRPYPIGSLIPFAVMAPVFLTIWSHGDSVFFWPAFPLLAWGASLVSRFVQVAQHNAAVPARLPAPAAVAAAPATPVAAELPAPVGGASAEVAGPRIPEALREEHAEVERLSRELMASGRGQVAESLEMGLREAVRLAHLRDQVGSIDAALAGAREEAAKLDAQAARATDEEARATWHASAEAATRRVEKLEAMRTVDDRAAARIASFRQLVKSLALDVTRNQLTQLDENATLSDLADQAHRVDREVEALHQTNDELRTFAAARKSQRA